MSAGNGADRALYLDSSALLKLIAEEVETPALLRAVAGRQLLSSELALTEVPRAVWRLSCGLGPEEKRGLIAGTEGLLNGLAYVPLTQELLLHAGSFQEGFLRGHDAIHIASALSVADELEAFVSYDGRQLDAVLHAKLPVLRPA
jgi:predicted nucleic acid-binding protein